MKTVFRQDTASFGASFSGDALGLENFEGYSVVASWTGTGAGTLALQACNNPFTDNVYLIPDPNAVWADIPGSATTVTSGSGSQTWNVSDVYYRAFRVTWTRTSGTGTYTAYIFAKGLQ